MKDENMIAIYKKMWYHEYSNDKPTFGKEDNHAAENEKNEFNKQLDEEQIVLVYL